MQGRHLSKKLGTTCVHTQTCTCTCTCTSIPTQTYMRNTHVKPRQKALMKLSTQIPSSHMLRETCETKARHLSVGRRHTGVSSGLSGTRQICTASVPSKECWCWDRFSLCMCAFCVHVHVHVSMCAWVWMCMCLFVRVRLDQYPVCHVHRVCVCTLSLPHPCRPRLCSPLHR